MRILLTLLSFLFSLNVYAQVNDSKSIYLAHHDEQYIREQKIRRIKVQGYINKQKPSIYLYEFDHKGSLINCTIQDSAGRKLSIHSYFYDSSGGLFMMRSDNLVLGRSDTNYFTRIYDQGKLVRETTMSLSYSHKYNAKGQRTESMVTGEHDPQTALCMAAYQYDSSGKLASIVLLSGRDIIEPSTFIYNDKAQIIEIRRPGKAGYFLTYGSNGLIKSILTRMPEEFKGIDLLDEYSYEFWH